MAKFNPKNFGLPRHPNNWDIDAVPALPRRVVKEEDWLVQARQKAWRAYEAALVVSDGDRELADRTFQTVINQERKRHGEKHPSNDDVGDDLD